MLELLKSYFKKVEKLNNKQWKPSIGGWLVTVTGSSVKSLSNSLTSEFGVEFNSERQATNASKIYRKFHRLYKLAEDLNEGWEPNWSDTSKKYYIFYKSNGNIYYTYNIDEPDYCTIYFKSECVALKVIEILKREV